MFKLIAGPCLIESEDTTMLIAKTLKDICDKFGIPLTFKGSYRKANRTNITSFQGIGDIKALEILQKVNDEFDIPVITDVHTPDEANIAAVYVNELQIPAFLCRQTDLLVACARTNLPVNIKKGQFASVHDIIQATDKLIVNGCTKFMVTERGTTFGYDDLVIDFRNIYLLNKVNITTIVDVTHSLGKHSGDPFLIIQMAKAALAMGADGIFIETHPSPKSSKSDGNRMFPLDQIEYLLSQLTKLC